MPIIVESAGAPFLNLDQVKRQLHITGDADDLDLTALIDAAQKAVERHIGKLVTSQQVSETLIIDSGTRHLTLRGTPVTSVDAITGADGTVYDASGLTGRTSGLLTLPYSLQGVVTVAYTAGLDPTPGNCVSAGQIIVQHLWETRRGAMPSVVAPLDSSLALDSGTGYLAGFAIPNKALELLGPRAPVVA